MSLEPRSMVLCSPTQAVLLTEGELQTNSFFGSFYDNALYGTGGSSVAADYEVRSKVLAEAIPATSRAAGKNDVLGRFSANIDLMSKQSGWPRSSSDWLHSDFKNVAYPYVNSFFDDMVSKGGLQ